MDIMNCVIALLALVVTYIVYKDNTLADVVVYAQVDLKRPTMINLVIHNIGKGVARNVMFDVEGGVPKSANGISGLTEPKKCYTNGAFVTGLPILFPDEKLVYSWGQLGGLIDALNGKPMEVVVSFTSNLAFQLWKKRITNKVLVDVACFEGVLIAEPFFEQELKKLLSDIAKSINSLK